MKPLHTSALAAQKANTPMIAPHPLAKVAPLEDGTMSLLPRMILLMPPLAKSAEPEHMQQVEPPQVAQTALVAGTNLTQLLFSIIVRPVA